MRCTWHQLLAAFLINLSPFLMNNGLQFSNILGFAWCNRLLQIPPEIFSSQMTVMANVESSRISSATKSWWNLKCDWHHCPVRSSNDGQAEGMFSHRISWYFNKLKSWLPHNCRFPWCNHQCLLLEEKVLYRSTTYLEPLKFSISKFKIWGLENVYIYIILCS